MILNGILFFLFLAMLGLTMRDGLWTNTLRLVNLLLAGLLASSLGPWVGSLLRGSLTQQGFYLNFLGMWIIFFFFISLLRELTKRLSTVKVKFHKLVNQIGGYVAAVLVAFFFLGFAMHTIHQAPLSKNCFRGGFDYQSRMFFGLAPDRTWEGFLSLVGGKTGALAGSTEFNGEDYRKNSAKGRQEFETILSSGGRADLSKYK